MSLVDPDRFEGACRTSNQSIDVSDVMRRLVKEDLLKFDGTPLFPERLAYTVNYDLSPMEAQLYDELVEPCVRMIHYGQYEEAYLFPCPAMKQR